MFCHIGIGKPYRRSYEFFLSDVITSSGAKKRYHNIVRIEGFLGYSLDIFVKKFREYTLHSYKYSNRYYYVFPDDFYNLFQSIDRLIVALYRYLNKDIDKVFEYIEEIASRCKNIDECINMLVYEKNRIEHSILKRTLRGKKALITRFKRNNTKCRDLAQKYFPDLHKPYVFTYKNSEELLNFMKKFFTHRIAEAYKRFAEINSPMLIARDGVILITKDSDHLNDFSIYVDDCIDKNNYAMLKVVGVYVLKDYVYRVRWVAILGLDKLSNQVFLHYLPPTLVLHKVERCRLWLLNIVDEFGRFRENNYTLIEV